MTDIEIHHNAPVTVSVDIEALLRSPGEPERDDEGDFVGEGSPLYAAIVHETARLLADKATLAMKQAVADMVVEAAAKEVEAIVSNVIEHGTQVRSDFGSPVTIPPLRDVIEQQVKEWLKPQGRGFGSSDAPLVKLVREHVDIALKRDFTAMLTEEREKIVARMKDVAAALFATEATKR